MGAAKVIRAACLVLGLTLAAVSCSSLQGHTGRDGVRGGTLRVLSTLDMNLDTAGLPYLARIYARTLYSYNLARPPDQGIVPVPDLADGPPQVSADRRTYTFTLRPGVRYAPPVNREVTSQDFITAIERLDVQTGLPLDIAGVAAFGAHKASHISGLSAPDPHTLTITLVKPEVRPADIMSGLTMPIFAPVPGEYAAHYQVGANYDGHVVGSGPYTPNIYIPGKLIVLDRNPNWDPATDPLRKAWVDHIRIELNVSSGSIQPAIERGEADLSLFTHVPQSQLAAVRADPDRSRRLSLNPSGNQLFLVLGTNPKAGAIADVRVRQAVNYAIDKVAYRDAVADRFGAAGEVASTILAPRSPDYRSYDLYPTPGGRGDPVKAKALLAQAGYPHGLTLTFATVGSGRLAAGNKVIVDSLKRAGIDLKPKIYKEGGDLWDKSLNLPAKRLEHQLGTSGWEQVTLGDNAREAIVDRFDGRLLNPKWNGNNDSEYNNPTVSRLIDAALAEPDPNRRAAIWAETDQRIMRDAPIVPLIWLDYTFYWPSRVHGWVYDPSATTPDLTAVWLDPTNP